MAPITCERTRLPGRAVEPRPGDLLFGQRPCPVQVLMNVTGDQWTHVAVVVPGDDGDGDGDGEGLLTVELGLQGIFTRRLADYLDAYRLIGVARPRASQRCRRAMTTAALVHARMGRADYSWAYCVLTGSTNLARRFVPDTLDGRVARAGRRALDHLPQRAGALPATCSSLVADLLLSACEGCRPHTRWPARRPVAPWRARPTVTDVVGLDGAPELPPDPGTTTGRALLTPSDLWVADGYEFRAVSDGTTTTMLRPAPVEAGTDHCRRGRAPTTDHRPTSRPTAPKGGDTMMQPQPQPQP